MSDKLTASESLYGFCAWLTCREKNIIMGKHNDCAEIAALVNEFCKVNRLKDPRAGWYNNLIHPQSSLKK